METGSNPWMELSSPCSDEGVNGHRFLVDLIPFAGSGHVRQGLMFPDECGKLFSIDRTGEEETLGELAPHLLQHKKLLKPLHPFSHHLYVHVVSQGNDRLYDFRIIFVRVAPNEIDEGAVDLEDVYGKLMEVVQR